jgi:NAD(P)-dependent dehydrogenase (short-subunit alcohol dehydrogenase family)
MRARRWGRIVNISSAAARGPGLVGVAYNASKAGVEGLTRGYAARAAKDGVTVNAVAPGPIDTEMAAPLKAGGVASRILWGAPGPGGRGSAGDGPGRRQRFHHRTDDRGERRSGVLVTPRTKRLSPLRAPVR